MTTLVTDKTLRAWLHAAPTDRSIGDGLIFFATAVSASKGKASWILRYRFNGTESEYVLRRYPDISLKEARDITRQHRGRIQQGIGMAAEQRAAKLKASERGDVANLAQAWYDRHIDKVHEHPEVVLRVIRRHIAPVIGKLDVAEVRPQHIDKVLTRIVDAGAPTVANDALRYLSRMFHFAVKRRWIDANPASGFEISDAGGTEKVIVRPGPSLTSLPNFRRSCRRRAGAARRRSAMPGRRNERLRCAG